MCQTAAAAIDARFLASAVSQHPGRLRIERRPQEISIMFLLWHPDLDPSSHSETGPVNP